GRLRLEDRVASGRSEVEVTLTSGLDLSANGPRVQFRAFRQQATGGVTTSNVTMTPVGPRTAVRLVIDNSRSQRPLQVGDVLDFELDSTPVTRRPSPVRSRPTVTPSATASAPVASTRSPSMTKPQRRSALPRGSEVPSRCPSSRRAQGDPSGAPRPGNSSRSARHLR
ncbi:MAG: hypothetical protein MUC96_20720, partial [Myxococcaceae bacterium]|nr:hypothetical protein [Myxococcaceae bacterium]